MSSGTTIAVPATGPLPIDIRPPDREVRPRPGDPCRLVLPD